jgi:protein TonB
MGYQALLFCPDEKLARVVTQVFGDLDFSVDPVHEPFAAVKKLMAQRYDAVVVDCENEQNASLLFKSARNSTSNQSSLAIALVEGQAGVAKAYRIGANLVLTKPINVEQAKGTLRVARGLLRKNSDAVGTPTVAASSGESAYPPKPTPVASSQPQGRLSPVPPLGSAPQESPKLPPLSFISQPSSTPPVVSASAEDEDILAPLSASAHSDSPIAHESPLDAQEVLSSTPEKSASPARKEVIHEVAAVAPVATTEAPAVVAPLVAVPAVASSAHVASGSAAAPAPAKETLAPEKHSTVAEPQPARIAHESASAPASPSTSENSGAPSFGILNQEPSDGSGGKKKILIAAAVLVVAGLGYFAYSYFAGGKPTSSVTPVATSQNIAQSAPVSAPATAPVSESSNVAQPPNPVAPAPNPTATTAAPGDKPAASSGASAVLRIAANAEPEMKKPAPAPMLVKPGTPATRNQPSSSDEPAAPPAIDAAASANNSNLTGLLASTSNIPKPSLATIRISQGVSQGLLIKRVQPTYPQSALAVHAQGAVQIEATVTKEGNVTNLKVLSGDAVLARAALDAVRQWRYKPYYLDGQPVEIQTQITVNFKAN